MTVIFTIIALVTLAGAVLAMSLRNLVHCALCLVLALGGLAALFLQLDAQGAGLHQRVVISSDGSAARNAVGDEKSPVRWMVIGVVDDL